MKTATADKIAFVSVLAVALMTAGTWAVALAMEQHLNHLMHTTYRQPAPQFRDAIAAGENDDPNDAHLARGR